MRGPTVKLRLRTQAEAILEAYQQGSSIYHLAERYGCSITPIRQLLKENGLQSRQGSRPNVLESIREQVVSRYQEGETALQLASNFGVNRKTVVSFLNQIGVIRKNRLGRRSFFIEFDADRVALARR